MKRANGEGSTILRGGVWYIGLTDDTLRTKTGRPRFIRRRTNAKTQEQAARLLKKWRDEKEAGGWAAIATNAKVKDVLAKLLKEYEHAGKKSLRTVRGHVTRLTKDIGLAPIAKLTRSGLMDLTARWLAAGMSKTTADKHMQTLRAAFNLSKLRLSGNDTFPMYGEANVRGGFCEPAEFGKVLSRLPHAYTSFVRWLYASGMRKGEAAALRWGMVHADELHVPAGVTKNGRARVIPLVADLATIIEEQRKLRHYTKEGVEHLSELVFHVAGEPVGDFRKAWARACKGAGLVGLLLHDLRRSAVRNLSQAGVGRRIAMSISGHLSEAVFERYSIKTMEEQREALRQVASYTEKAGQKVRVEPICSQSAPK